MAFPTGFITVTNAADIIRFSSQRPVPLRPVLAVIWRRSLWIHIHMARGAVHPPTVRLLANPDLHLVSHLRNPLHRLAEQRPVTLCTTVRQGGGMHKDTSPNCGELTGFLQGQIVQVLDFVAHPAGFRVDLLGFNPILMAFLTRRVRSKGKTPVRHLAVAIRAGHPIVSDVQVMTEGEFVILFLVASSQQNHRHQPDSGLEQQKLHSMCLFHNFTSTDARHL